MNTSYKRIVESQYRIREEAVLDITEKYGNYNSVSNQPFKIIINSEMNRTTIEIKKQNKILLKQESIENLISLLNKISDKDILEALNEHTYTLPFASGRIKSLIGGLEDLNKLMNEVKD